MLPIVRTPNRRTILRLNYRPMTVLASRRVGNTILMVADGRRTNEHNKITDDEAQKIYFSKHKKHHFIHGWCGCTGFDTTNRKHFNFAEALDQIATEYGNIASEDY